MSCVCLLKDGFLAGEEDDDMNHHTDSHPRRGLHHQLPLQRIDIKRAIELLKSNPLASKKDAKEKNEYFFLTIQ